MRKIWDHFIDSSDYSTEMNNNRRKLDQFDEWVMTFDLSELD